MNRTVPWGDVEFKKGHYHDGIYVKKNNLVLALVETSGGVCPPSSLPPRHVGRLHRRTRTPGAVDRTHYGSVRMSPKSYFVHHTQQLSKAAVPVWWARGRASFPRFGVLI